LISPNKNYNTKEYPVFPEQMKSGEGTLFQKTNSFVNMSASLLIDLAACTQLAAE
jgi:hypothetical protein